MKHILYSALAALGLSVPSPVTAEPVPERDSARVFVFGNSLIHHLTDTDETTVPHWLAEMARHDGRDLALDGRFGFPREFAAELPPVPNWSFDAVTPAWNRTLVMTDAIGAHFFHRWKGYWGTAAAFTKVYRGGEPQVVTVQ